MSKIQIMLSDVALNLEKEGDATKEYEALKTRLKEEIHFTKMRMEDSGPEPVPEEEKEKCEHYIEQLKYCVEKIDEIISDELNHAVILIGMLSKLGKVMPNSDGLAEAINEIVEE